MENFKKIRVAILMGGPSSEHEVSLKSGENVFNYLDKKKYEAEKIIIDKNGNWPISLKDLKDNFDICFIALHGRYGEDGIVQMMLEEVKMPYTGSSSLVSALCMNKYLTLDVLKRFNLLVPNSFLISKYDWQNKNSLILEKIKLYFPYPIVVKPNDHGSSYLISLIRNDENLIKALNEIFQVSNLAIVQEYIKGREFTCGVLDYGLKNTEYALVPTEIIVKDREFFDYYAKYHSDLTLEITPPKINHNLIENIKKTAILTHKILNCRGISRTDFILDERNRLYILEINTIPGLTEKSLIPKQALAYNLDFSVLLDRIILAGFNACKY